MGGCDLGLRAALLAQQLCPVRILAVQAPACTVRLDREVIVLADVRAHVHAEAAVEAFRAAHQHEPDVFPALFIVVVRVPAAAVDLVQAAHRMKIAATQEDDCRLSRRRRLRHMILREIEQRLARRKQQFLEGEAALFVEDHVVDVRDLRIADAVGAGEGPAAFKANRGDDAIRPAQRTKEGIDSLGTANKAHRLTSFPWYISYHKVIISKVQLQQQQSE